MALQVSIPNNILGMLVQTNQIENVETYLGEVDTSILEKQVSTLQTFASSI